MTTKTPIYFFSHGGPNVMYDTKHPVYPQLQKIGHEITHVVKPKAIVVFSAHWQAERDTIEVNTAEDTDLLYDYYGFPAQYYRVDFPQKGSPTLAKSVMESLMVAGIKTRAVKRGIDHGVFACFKVTFDPVTNPLNIPIVQVSLFDTEDGAQHIALGKAVSGLREQGVQIIVSGMAVHNLQDFRMSQRGGPASPMSYTQPFDALLRDAVETPSLNERAQKMLTLLQNPLARRAHPTFEHLLPIYVGVGAAGEDRGTRLWTMPEGSMSWAMFRFGEVGGVGDSK